MVFCREPSKASSFLGGSCLIIPYLRWVWQAKGYNFLFHIPFHAQNGCDFVFRTSSGPHNSCCCRPQGNAILSSECFFAHRGNSAEKDGICPACRGKEGESVEKMQYNCGQIAIPNLKRRCYTVGVLKESYIYSLKRSIRPLPPVENNFDKSRPPSFCVWSERLPLQSWSALSALCPFDRKVGVPKGKNQINSLFCQGLYQSFLPLKRVAVAAAALFDATSERNGGALFRPSGTFRSMTGSTDRARGDDSAVRLHGYEGGGLRRSKYGHCTEGGTGCLTLGRREEPAPKKKQRERKVQKQRRESASA